MELPVGTYTSKGIILDLKTKPTRIFLAHNNADPVGPDGKEGKPAGWGLPGGGGEDGETPLETARREVKSETGIVTAEQPASWTDGLEEFGVVLPPEHNANHTLYVFHLEMAGFEKVTETSETGRWMASDLASILLMPVAKQLIKYPSGRVEIRKNPEGMYYGDRERIFKFFDCPDYNFLELIPNLPELYPNIRRDEVGEYIHDTLCSVLQAAGYDVFIKGNSAVVSKSWRPPTDEELEGVWRPVVEQKPVIDPDEEYRKWAKKVDWEEAIAAVAKVPQK